MSCILHLHAWMCIDAGAASGRGGEIPHPSPAPASLLPFPGLDEAPRKGHSHVRLPQPLFPSASLNPPIHPSYCHLWGQCYPTLVNIPLLHPPTQKQIEKVHGNKESATGDSGGGGKQPLPGRELREQSTHSPHLVFVP